MADPIEQWVKEMKAKGKYEELPKVIQNCWVQMEEGNYIVPNLQDTMAIAQPLLKHLGEVYGTNL